eukprot:gene2875-4517_t
MGGYFSSEEAAELEDPIEEEDYTPSLTWVLLTRFDGLATVLFAVGTAFLLLKALMSLQARLDSANAEIARLRRAVARTTDTAADDYNLRLANFIDSATSPARAFAREQLNVESVSHDLQALTQQIHDLTMKLQAADHASQEAEAVIASKEAEIAELRAAASAQHSGHGNGAMQAGEVERLSRDLRFVEEDNRKLRAALSDLAEKLHAAEHGWGPCGPALPRSSVQTHAPAQPQNNPSVAGYGAGSRTSSPAARYRGDAGAPSPVQHSFTYLRAAAAPTQHIFTPAQPDSVSRGSTPAHRNYPSAEFTANRFMPSDFRR